MSLPQHWIDLQPGASPGVQDRAFLYGDSLFETLRYHRHHLHWLDLHLQRLQMGAQRLDIPFPAAAIDQHLDLAMQWLEQHAIDDACLRLTLSRGISERGYAAQSDAPLVAVQLSDVPLAWGETPAALELKLCQLRLGLQPTLAGLKHGNRLEQVLAARELGKRGAKEGLLLNQREELASAVSANVFVVVDGELLTPPVHECGVAGTVRKLVLEQLAVAACVAAREQVLLLADLAHAQEMFLTNALFGIRSVKAFDGHRFTSTAMGDNLRRLFIERSESCP